MVGDVPMQMRYPQTYNQAGTLTTAIFWKTGVFMAVVDAALCFFVCYYTMNSPGSFETDDVYSVGKTTYIAILGAVTLEVRHPFQKILPRKPQPERP
jgi:phospholipid-transporting ATPase